MHLTDLLSPERVSCDNQASSKKRVLEMLSDLIAGDGASFDRNEVFDSLLSRERLGSTGLGHGVAIPHGRLKESSQAIGAFIKLRDGIDYDAMDHQPVDLLFALLVPEHSTEEHLQLLAKLAEMFSNPEVVGRLRHSHSAEQLLAIVRDWQSSH